MSVVLGSGKPRTQGEVKDNSVIVRNDGAGVTGVLGITEMGELNKPTLIENWNDYKKKFGGLVSYSNFPLYCFRALESGAVLMISRLAHYTDIANKDTAVGVAATKVSNGGTFEAKNIGSWGNEVIIVLSENVNYPDKWDITVNFRGITETRRLSKTPTELELNGFNTTFLFVNITTATTLTAGTVVLSGGSENYTDFANSDMLGDAQANTGLHSFDNEILPIRISPMERNNPEIETYFTTWAKKRNNILCVFPAPTNIQAAEAIDYRERNGSYAGFPAINYWGAIQTYGDIEINDPNAESGTIPAKLVVSSIGDFIGAMGYRDKLTKGQVWRTFAFSEYGKIRNVLSVPYNLGSPSLETEAHNMSNHKFNYVINHPTFGAVIWDANTLQKEDTLLKHSNVAELLIYIIRKVKPLAEKQLGKPNTPDTWRKIYNDVAAVMSELNSNQALFGVNQGGNGEGDSWAYEGDQDITDLSEMTVNNSNDVDNGIYRFRLFFKPTSPLKFIGYELSVTNSGVTFTVIE